MKSMATPEILVRARNAFKMGEYPARRKLAMRILEDQPDSAVAYNLLGASARRRAGSTRPSRCSRRRWQLKPDYTEAHNNLGSCTRGSRHTARPSRISSVPSILPRNAATCTTTSATSTRR